MNDPIDNKAISFLRMIRQSQRGRLKIYLGYCAGVGKTYQMLLEARRLKEDGIDVVVGYVETHARPETAQLLNGLEIMPRIKQEYRGVPLEEMDVAAILARKPEVALIDELAHTNVPGSRNQKRYEDVQDILDAGIHVITTLNVQHLESLYNTVENTLGVKVRERLPDIVLLQADQIVNVDLTTEDLRRRLEGGKIYPLERIETALMNFFRESNLEQLREITLRELAAHIDARRRDPSEQEITLAPDQVMVCLSSQGPNSEMLLRYASRLAGKLNRNWYALYVQTPSEDPEKVDTQTQQMLSSTLTLAKQLGAMVFTYKGENIADTILQFAREYRVGHIVIGRPGTTSRWKRILDRRTIVECLIEKAEGLTVVVLDTVKGLPVIDKRLVETTPVKPPPHANVPATIPKLSTLLSSKQIIVWDKPVLKEDILNTLVMVALWNFDFPQQLVASQKIWEREQQGSTFFNEGVAFPHVRLDGLDQPRLALGITHHGVVDVAAQKPIEVVFLILTPLQQASAQLQILALSSKAGQNRHLIQQLKKVDTPEQAMEAIQDWEAQL
ncbi:MAG TPA: PTS sugar transporter subunit IIA [Candidatus Hydrogenedentes bacterium]|nr:PTS sugar transporter subunit IIA [Candidatus Hydrogenedentota bacterium]